MQSDKVFISIEKGVGTMRSADGMSAVQSRGTKLSIALCTYNGAKYLPDQLRSIVTQARVPDELIICDDGSQDDTCQIIEEFAANAGFCVRLNRNDSRLGTVSNFEQAIRLCSGEIIVLCDQDDVWDVNKLARIEDIFSTQPDTGLVVTDAEIVDEDLRPLQRRLWEYTISSAKWRRICDGLLFEVLLAGDTVTGATLALRARVKELILPIPTDIGMLHDGWIALMIAAVANVRFVPTPLIKYRQHSEQLTGIREPVQQQAHSWFLPGRGRSELRAMCQSELCKLRTIQERLEHHREAYPCGPVLECLENMINHLEVRAGLPAMWPKRCRSVVKELVTGRYYRFSNGLCSAAKDLLL